MNKLAGYVHLFYAELRRRWSLAKAYPSEELVGTLMMAVFFYMLFLGTKFMAGPGAQFGDRLDAIVVGYVVWILMMHTYSGMATDLQSERSMGTIEQLMMSPPSFSTILLARSMADVLFSLVLTTVVGGLIMFLTGAHLQLSPLMVLPVATVIMSSAGLGFIVGSLVFIFKQVRSLQMIFQFALLFGIMAPIEAWGGWGQVVGALVPVAPGASALRMLLVQGHFDLTMSLLALVNGVFYLALGLAIFRLLERKAKKKGMVSHF